MNTIKYLERFSRNRGKFDFYGKDSDIERLRRSELAMYSLVLGFSIFLVGHVDSLFDEEFFLGGGCVWIFIALYCCYLMFEIYRVGKVIELFLKHGPSSATELLERIESESNESAN